VPGQARSAFCDGPERSEFIYMMIYREREREGRRKVMAACWENIKNRGSLIFWGKSLGSLENNMQGLDSLERLGSIFSPKKTKKKTKTPFTLGAFHFLFPHRVAKISPKKNFAILTTDVCQTPNFFCQSWVAESLLSNSANQNQPC